MTTPPPVSSTEAKNRPNALLAQVGRTGVGVTVTTHDRPVPRWESLRAVQRRFGQLPGLIAGADFDEPLPECELDPWDRQ